MISLHLGSGFLLGKSWRIQRSRRLKKNEWKKKEKIKKSKTFFPNLSTKATRTLCSKNFLQSSKKRLRTKREWKNTYCIGRPFCSPTGEDDGGGVLDKVFFAVPLLMTQIDP